MSTQPLSTPEFCKRLTLLIFLLKARDPEQYCDKARSARIEREHAASVAASGEGAPVEREKALAAIEALERIALEKASGAPVAGTLHADTASTTSAVLPAR